MKYRGPYYLQAYAWSAILSKRNVIGLGPVGGGKTLAYVAPIVSMLLKDCSQVRKDTLTMVQAKYLQVQSPPVVVLCSSWRNVKVFALFDDCSPCPFPGDAIQIFCSFLEVSSYFVLKS